MATYARYNGLASGSGGGGGGVSSLNGETGAVNIVAGSGITVTPAGQNITVAATGGGGTVTSVTASAPLSSSGGNTPNISLTGIVSPVDGGAPPVTKTLYVDVGRTDSFTSDGSLARPFLTISAAISQIITNADNGTTPYTVLVYPGTYNETLTFNSAALHNLVFTAIGGSGNGQQNTIVNATNVLVSTSNNTQLATLVFNGITFNGSVNFVGDINNTNFASSQILFVDCQFNNSAGTIVLTNLNNINFYGCQIQGSGSVSTFTNLAFAYMSGPEGFVSGTVLHLVQNNGGNQPSQALGNYLLFNETKFYGTVTIDAGSEMDALESYFGSNSSVTNNGIIHSWNASWSGTAAVVLNSGSTTRTRGDFFYIQPTVNTGATFTTQGGFYSALNDFSQIATPSNPASGHDVLYFKSDDKLYGLNHAGVETLIGPSITALTGDGTATGPGSVAFTLATVNSNVGSFGSSTAIPSFTVNGKGLITAASTNVVIAPAGTLSGTTLNATVVSSSLTSVGTISSGTWAGTTIAINHGGTGATTATAGFNALAPTQTGNNGKFLSTNGTNAAWSTVTASPAGADTQVQFNNAGVTAGDANFTWNTATQKLGVNGTITDGDGSNVLAIDLTTGTRLLNDSGGLVSLDFNSRVLRLGNGTDVLDWSNGNASLTTLGTGLQIKTGTNSKLGTAVLSGGTVTVANTSVTANSLIFLTSQADGGVPGFLRITAKTAGTSFVITSSSVADTSTVAWNIIESIP